jgi:signal transduction histidine kinase
MVVRLNSGTLRANLLNDSKSFAALATEPIGKTFLTYKDSGNIPIGDNIHRFTDLDTNITNVMIVDTSGKVVFSQNKTEVKTIPEDQAASFQPVYLYDGNNNLKQVVSPFFEDYGTHRYSMVYEVTTTEVQASIRQFLLSIMVFIALALVVSVTLTYLLINRMFIDPIRRVSRQAMAISAGQLDQQIEVDRDDEISDLAKSVNAMAQSLKDDITKLRETDRLKTEFMIIASHNLRTPLSVINGYLEQSEDLNTVEELRKAISVIAGRSKQLGVFAEDILTISSIEAGRNLPGLQPTVFADYMQALADEFKPIAEQKGLKFESDIQSGIYRVNISAPHFRSAVWNLLDNALKFTDKNGSIHVTVETEDHNAIVRVKDSGIGISKEEQPKVFTKFHRGTDIMNSQYEGTGIGLYATKLVVEKHDGSVSLKSEVGKGSTFTIKLPLVGED